MNPYAQMSTEGHEAREDRAGGGYSAFETDVYEMDIKVVFAGKSAKGAHFATVIGEINGQEYRETIYTTNREGKNSYPIDKSKPDGKQATMPGYVVIDDMALAITNNPLAAQNVEEKIVKLYDYEQKKEIPTSVPVFVDLVGGKIKVAIQKTLENKTKQQGTEYVPIAETREVNTIQKVFEFNSSMTIAEAEHGATEAAFINTWTEKNKGKTKDARTIKDGEGGTPAGAPQATGQAAPAGGSPVKSLFGAKA